MRDNDTSMRMERLAGYKEQSLPDIVAKASVSFGHSHTCLGGERLSGKEPVHRSWARVLALADNVLF